jgi:hypothetical protein
VTFFEGTKAFFWAASRGGAMIVVHWQIVLPYSQFFARYMHCWKLSVPLMCANWNLF